MFVTLVTSLLKIVLYSSVVLAFVLFKTDNSYPRIKICRVSFKIELIL